jgi:hypothetical protein
VTSPPASVVARRPRIPASFVVPALLVVGAAVRALRFAAPFHWPFVWDETQWAVPALYVLRGLGLLAGLGWWTTPLILVYLAPFAVLAVRTGLVLRPRIGWVAAGLLLGGLPHWLYELW